MSTVFIAVQCFQCSTMQVKQQKKSSNKWTCVVCNEKQSVRKVFAQGFMARDVRKYVQVFNMNRQFADKKRAGNETLDPLPPEDSSTSQIQSNREKRRTDWSQYIDPIDDHDGRVEDKQEDAFEPKIVTEMPKAVFKKPKLNPHSSRLGIEDSEKGFRPVFSKRNSSEGKEPRKFQQIAANWASKEQQRSLAKGDSKWSSCATQEKEDGFPESRGCHLTTAKGSSKWHEYIIQDTEEEEEEENANKVERRYQPRKTKGASKWDSYVTDDEDGDDFLQLKIGRESADQMG